MIRTVTRGIIRNLSHKKFSKITKKNYNKLWNTAYYNFMQLKPSIILDIINKLNKFTSITILAIPTILLIIKNSGIFSKEDYNHEKRLITALDLNNSRLDLFIWIIILYTLFVRFIKFIFKLLWIPFKIALIFYLLDYLEYDITYIYTKINNLSLGIIGWFYNAIIDLNNLFNPSSDIDNNNT